LSGVKSYNFSDSPKTYLDTMAKKDRMGRILLDGLRNDRTSKVVTVLSSRAHAGAPISLPAHWKEVKVARSSFAADVLYLKMVSPGPAGSPRAITFPGSLPASGGGNFSAPSKSRR
jgi:hypothetical protein